MKIFKVGFKSDYIYSVNMIWANTGKEEYEAVKETAERRAERFGYEVAFITEISEDEAQTNINKGMPYYSIDEQAEKSHDASFNPERTEQEKTDKENREHCKSISEELDKVVNGQLYKCPMCGEVIVWNNDNYNDDEQTYTCSECGETFEESELVPVDLIDYFADCLDIEYRIGQFGAYRSVKIMVAYGGPNIYIDTASGSVELYWWTDRASFPLSYNVVEAIDREFEEFYSCNC